MVDQLKLINPVFVFSYFRVIDLFWQPVVIFCAGILR